MNDKPKQKISRLPPRPDLEWGEDGVPRDQINDDVYFSVSNGLEETREVFFRGCGLPERWQGQGDFTIAELGFGTGLNIVALIKLWREYRPSQKAKLHVVSFEGRLMHVDSARSALKAWSELAEEAEILLSNWPERARGVQRLDLGNGMSLILHQDEILPALQNAKFEADAWFLDGFSPAKNPAMWSSDVMMQVGRHSSEGALIGTYTVAGHVRRSLSEAGFEVSKQPGFGKKRERLEAIFKGKPANLEKEADPLLLDCQEAAPQSVAIVGAGIMGACLAHAFKQRGCDVRVLDQANSVEEGASANPLGLVAPRLDGADTPQARLLIDAYLAARRFYRQFPDHAWFVDVEHFANSETEEQRQRRVIEDPPFDDGLLGVLLNGEGLKYKGGVAVKPADLRKQLLSNIEVEWGVSVSDLNDIDADLVILASGLGIKHLTSPEGVPLRGRGGQLEYANTSVSALARSKGHYIVGADETLVFGATYEDCENDVPELSQSAREKNIKAVAEIAPEINVSDLELQSRTAVRAVTNDQLPIVGRVPDFEKYKKMYGEDLRTGRRLNTGRAPYQKGVYVAGGLGSRGLTWAPFLAQYIAAEIFDEPLPTGRGGRELLSPARFYMRTLKRAKKE
ncbi:FAD-dependent 5-carboxymethylaminomethyl-2-thiouridine(34) oxidoreductase MnmC [Hirschia maritima]|uniref:FAD-dependent 5-carboxymethylaminomethyl-2-thiouridine(34) oxidoreductase MnmC n=1 Tax=Hirschia maritima TaxID=1121961 RepID=UPI0003768900|nr:FAD-dependent 5-carboxymethylaminomethyl-2-thiouridine(34) oxidoreductase MnmC [Hirschia maritima]